jgi:Domain of unknown function (DUF4282)
VETGFFKSLFDWSFTHVVTPRLVKVLYVLVVIFSGLGVLGYVVVGFRFNPVFGILVLLIFGPIYFLLVVMYTRVILEVLVTIFKMEQHLAVMAGPGGRPGGSTRCHRAGPRRGCRAPVPLRSPDLRLVGPRRGCRAPVPLRSPDLRLVGHRRGCRAPVPLRSPDLRLLGRPRLCQAAPRRRSSGHQAARSRRSDPPNRSRREPGSAGAARAFAARCHVPPR